MVIEQEGRDIWRGRHRSLHDAITAGEAAIGVDKVLLQRAIKHGVTCVLVVIEEQRRIFLASLQSFFDEELARTRANYQGRSHRLIPYERYHAKYLGPHLRPKQKRASAC